MICLSRLVAAAKSSYPMQGGQTDESQRATHVFHKEADTGGAARSIAPTAVRCASRLRPQYRGQSSLSWAGISG